jgi:hypothetical protein
MRRILSLPILASLLLAATASAAPLIVGIHGGSAIPNLRDNGGNEISQGWSSRVAPAFGVSADLPLSSVWSVLAEVNFTGQGGKRDGLQPVTDAQLAQAAGGLPVYAKFKNVAKFSYIEIPLLLEYHLPALLRPTIAAGPYVGFLTSAENVTSGSSTVYFRDPSGTLQTIILPSSDPLVADFAATTDIKSDLKTFNWGIQAGFGAALPYGRGAITLDVRGGMGFTDIQKNISNGKNTTGALIVALGYALPVGS